MGDTEENSEQGMKWVFAEKAQLKNRRGKRGRNWEVGCARKGLGSRIREEKGAQEATHIHTRFYYTWADEKGSETKGWRM